MTISKNPNTSKPLESQASPLVPSLEADPGGSQVGAISPALAPDPSGPSQKAVNPGAGLPQGLGTSLIGPFPPNENDPRLSLAAKDIKDLWPLSLNFYEAYHGQVGSEAPLAWPGPEAAREPNLSAHGPEPAGPTAEAPPAWPELAAPPGPYGEMAPKSTKYPLTAAPFDLSGAGPLMAALGLPQAEIPNLGAINQVVAESQFLPSWLTGEAPQPPWRADWGPALEAARPRLDPQIDLSESPRLEVYEPQGYPGAELQKSAPKAAPGSWELGLAKDFQNLAALAPPPYVGAISVERIREDFPILQTTVEGGQPLIWFDNAATTQKPRQVIDRLVKYYLEENSNVHRGAHSLASKATEAFEEARRKVAAFIGAGAPENIVFVRGTTEGINLVAQAFVAPRLNPGDEIILTELEHHANIVPWQMVASQKGAYLKVLPIDDQGQLILSKLPGLITPRTKVMALAHVSNALGTVTELSEIISLAKSQGIPVVIDAAQSVAHLPLEVKSLGADFLVFSGHKIYGPTGIGVVYGTTEALNQAQPWQGGGNMISEVTFEKTLYREAPVKFEAGTANIAGAIGLAAALDYVGALGLDKISLYEEALLHYLTDRLRTIPGLTLIGTPAKRAGLVSFVLANRSVAEVGTHLSRYGLALRAGHHCAQPAVRHFGLEGTVRPSPAFYNTPAEVDRLIEVLGLLV